MREAEIQHRPRRGTDILAHLRPDEDEGGLKVGHGRFPVARGRIR
jgi:hypothetical protein